METEVQLLELLIKAECRTKTAFATKIGMSRQNINYHIREAEKNRGKFLPEFKHALSNAGLDLYRFERQPTNDFYQKQGITPMNTHQEKIIELLEREIELRKRLEKAEKERDDLKAKLPPKKGSRRRSA